MRDLVGRYLERGLSRREFVQLAGAAGFSLAAARSAVTSLAPIVGNDPVLPSAGSRTFTVTGTGGELLAEQLRATGTRFLFVCNSSGMGPLCDALIDRPELQFIQGTCEHQVVAMADGLAKVTGRPSVACFSRVGGPLGSANMYNAMKDRTPLLVVTDHASTRSAGRHGHEDIDDWLQPFEQYTKWRWLVTEGERIPERVGHAFKLAATSPGGPTFLRIPRNVMYEKGLRAEVFPEESLSVPMHLVPDPGIVERAARMLLESRSPLLHVGPEVWASGARAAVVELAELLAIPAVQARSWAADFPTDHPLFLGEYLFPMRFPREIDLFLNLGAQMPDQKGGPPLVPRSARIVHARIESGQMGVNYPIDLAVVGDVKETARALVEAVKSLAAPARLAKIRASREGPVHRAARRLQDAYLAAASAQIQSDGPLAWPHLLAQVNAVIDEDAVVVDELGTENWVLRSFPFAEGKKTKIGRTLGRSLGWGVGASIGVKIGLPDRQVVSLQGDGSFLFGQSDALWSMSRYDVPIITIICNNRSYDEPRNNIFMREGRSAQEGKDMICYLGSPDVSFAEIAGAYGIRGERVTRTGDLGAALKRAVAETREGRPYLLDVHVARTGMAAASTWYPTFSVAASRSRRV